MITIARKTYFSSGIQDASTQRLYGHNFTLEAYVSGTENSTSGLVMNLTDLDRILKKVVAPLDHINISLDHPVLNKKPYSLSVLAQFLFFEIKKQLEQDPRFEVQLNRIRLSESDDIHAEVHHEKLKGKD